METNIPLTHWGRVTHICVGELTTIGSDNGFSPGRRQAIIWTNAGILLIEPLWTNFSEILIGIQIFSFKKMRLKMSSAKWRPFCLGLNVLIGWAYDKLTRTWPTRTKIHYPLFIYSLRSDLAIRFVLQTIEYDLSLLRNTFALVNTLKHALTPN